MPRTKPDEEKRKRKEKFSAEELRVFGEQLQVHGELLFISPRSTLAQKTVAWAAMTDSINAVSLTKRKVVDIKKRWQDVKGKVRRDLDAHRRQLAMTGGGPTPELTWLPWEQIAMAYMDEETLHGVGPVDHGDTEPLNTGDDERPSTSRAASGHSRPPKRQAKDDGDVVVVTPPPPPPPRQQQPSSPAAAQPVVHQTAASPGPAGAPDDDVVILTLEPVQQGPTDQGTIRAIRHLVRAVAKPARQGEHTGEGTQGAPQEDSEDAEDEGVEEAVVSNVDVGLHLPEPAATPEPQTSPLPIGAPTPVPPHAPPPVPSEAPLLAPASPLLRTPPPTPRDREPSDLGRFSDACPVDRLSPRLGPEDAAPLPPAADPAMRLAITDMTRRLCVIEQQMVVVSEGSQAQTACSLRTAVAAEALAAASGGRSTSDALGSISTHLESMSKRLGSIADNQVAIAKRQRNLTRQCARACTEMGNKFLTLSNTATTLGEKVLGLTTQMANSMKAMVDLAAAMSSRPAAAPLTPVRAPSSSASAEPSASDVSNPPSQASSPGTSVSRRSTRSGAHLPHAPPSTSKRGRK